MNDVAWRPPTWVRVARVLVPAVALAYAVTLLPDVRGTGGPRFVPWLEIGVGDGVLVASGLLCLARGVLVAHARWAWVLVGIGPLLYVGGDLVYYGFLADLAAPPYPSWSDALWLALY